MRNLPAWIPNLNSWMSAALLAAIVSLATKLVQLLSQLLTYLLLFLQLFLPILNFLLRILSLLPDFLQMFFLWFFQVIFVAISYLFTIATTISAPLLLLVPIVVISFSHHYLHLFLDRFFPDLRLPEMEKVTVFFPSIMSWWEGFYGLLVIIVALLLSDITLSFLTVNQNERSN